MMTAALGFLSTALLFWSATTAGERRSVLIGTVGFGVLVAAMVGARAERSDIRRFVDPIGHAGPVVCHSRNIAAQA
jgi:hypothetical protein